MKFQIMLERLAAFAPSGARLVNDTLTIALTLGALLLLRPVTGKIFTPKQQARVWLFAWICLSFDSVYDLMGQLVIPYTFRYLLAVPTYGLSYAYGTKPRFFSEQVNVNLGEQVLYLPGGEWTAVSVSEIALGMFVVVQVVVCAGLLIWAVIQRRRLVRVGRAGTEMPLAEREAYGLDSTVAVRRCKGLSTSFVRIGHDTGRRDGVEYVICLQDELPDEQLRLILLHEKEHIEQSHPFLKTVLTIMLYLNWWNPVVWIAYRIACRDMELGCDDAVMEKLDPAQRREYARTLVELASGKHLWGAVTTFGECDAAIRVRRLVAWRSRGEGERHLTDLLVLLLIMFFFCGNSARTDRAPVVSPNQGEQLQIQWEEFLLGPEFEAELKDVFGADTEIAQLWENEENTVLKRVVFVHTTDGQWLRCAYNFEPDGSQVGGGMSGGYVVEDGGPEGYIRIR